MPGLPLASAGSVAAVHSGPLFLIDDSRRPTVEVSWPLREGGTASISGERAYLAPLDRQPLGFNLAAYAGLGGVRLEVGASDPRGAVVRAGFYKVDGRKPLFEGIADEGAVTVTMRDVKFLRPAKGRAESVVMHARFDDPNSVLGCAASAGEAARNNVLDHYNTASATETLNGRIVAKNGRFGVLSADRKQAGWSSVRTEEDGTITMTARIPYAYFKHPDDPWLLNSPGSFVEPFHFHIEFEVLPVDAAEVAPTAE